MRLPSRNSIRLVTTIPTSGALGMCGVRGAIVLIPAPLDPNTPVDEVIPGLLLSFDPGEQWPSEQAAYLIDTAMSCGRAAVLAFARLADAEACYANLVSGAPRP